jgi:hypothetical protein
LIWLKPTDKVLPFIPQGKYVLLQKDRTFLPHLQVVPVGSTVQFPNADPFFHNVFSLFDGRRFDLGLYEAGSSKFVSFNREGVSYIFCNIHPEMSAVIIALSTPLYTVTQVGQEGKISGVPAGDYELHFWVEGAPQNQLDAMTRSVTIAASGHLNLGDIAASIPAKPAQHTNKFGSDYPKTSPKVY